MTFELPQNRIIADWHRQSRQQLLACPAASGMAEQSHEVADALRFSRKGKRRRQSFDESLSRAPLVQASPPPQAQLENDRGCPGLEGLAGAGGANYGMMLTLLRTRGTTAPRLHPPIRTTGSPEIQRCAQPLRAQRLISSSSCAIEAPSSASAIQST
jgi:hypothetical protein